MPKCLICDSDMEEWSDEPCEECQAVIEDAVEGLAILDTDLDDDLFVIFPYLPQLDRDE